MYHSDYDDFYWYSHFSDTSFVYGRTLSQVTSTAMLRLAGAPLLPFEFGRFANTVTTYVDEIEKAGKQSGRLNLSPVRAELDTLKKSAARFDATFNRAVAKIATVPPDKLRATNELLFRSERTMTLAAGLPHREWFKHSIYAPGTYTGYGVKTLPAFEKRWKAIGSMRHRNKPSRWPRCSGRSMRRSRKRKSC